MLAACLAVRAARRIATRNITGDHAIGQTHLSVFIDRFEQRGATVTWEPTRGKSGIIRLVMPDQLTRTAWHLALDVTAKPTTDDGCNHQLATITRVQADDHLLDAFETEQLTETVMRSLASDPATSNSAHSPLVTRRTSPIGGTPAPASMFAAVARPPSGKPMLGNCHMDMCSWGRDQSVTLIRQNNQGRLVRLVTLGGTSADDRSPITWDKDPHDVFVFCSMRSPAVIVKSGSEWNVDVLDFVNGRPTSG